MERIWVLFRQKSSVKGSGNKKYNVYINTEKLRISKCNCAFAKDRRVICKHIVALYFTIFETVAVEYLAILDKEEKEAEEREKELHIKIKKHVKSLPKKELEQIVLDLLYNAHEWQCDQFVRYRID